MKDSLERDRREFTGREEREREKGTTIDRSPRFIKYGYNPKRYQDQKTTYEIRQTVHTE